MIICIYIYILHMITHRQMERKRGYSFIFILSISPSQVPRRSVSDWPETARGLASCLGR